MTRELLVVACSRSGTRFISELLRHNGLDLRHQAIGRYGAVGFMFASARPYLGLRSAAGIRFGRTWHQVRHPLAAIASMQTHSSRMIRWLMAQIGPEREPRSRLEALMLYWLEWNRRCELMAEWTYRVEDVRPGTETWESMRKALGLCELRSGPSCRTNSRRHGALSWADLEAANMEMTERIRRIASGYGYTP